MEQDLARLKLNYIARLDSAYGHQAIGLLNSPLSYFLDRTEGDHKKFSRMEKI